MGLKRPLIGLLNASVILALLTPPAPAGALTPPVQVAQLFEAMTPQERVGQLFLIKFTGQDTAEGTLIHDLIVNHHVGGVVLSAANDNFVDQPDTLAEAHNLIESLQRMEWQGALSAEVDPVTGETLEQEYVPLFVGIAQEGNGYPTDQILSGMTPLPGQMAIGASWDTGMADQVGQVLGQELAALGFNLYFGPSLDVMETPYLAAGDLGTRVFGGDPFWVGEMGRAYITGLHAGSGGQLTVIAKHFPGRGGSDRPPEQEIPTIRKSLEQLKQIELAPFFAVTGNAPVPEAMADGLLLSHIRYQGFQGNIRATTRPMSFDPQALSQILGLEQFAGWRQDGGLLVSDDLSTRAVRDFYSQGGQTFLARLVARDALLAGNDLLNLGNLISGESLDTYQTTLRILSFFVQKYGEDAAFAQRVDEAVLRILTAKQRMYGNFTLARVLTSEGDLAEIGAGSTVTFDVARRAATLISPNTQDLPVVMPVPPQVRERLVFITDLTAGRQCTACLDRPGIPLAAMQDAVLHLYGPEGDNQTSTFRLSSYSFESLQQMLDGNDPPYIETDLQRANWVVLLTAGADRGQPELVSRFLSERQDLLRDRRVILFSFGAPYYLDATDISKLTAYYALFSKQPPFVDVAARLLFQEVSPAGASPVSVPGVGYDLIQVMAPDPSQVIPLSLDLPAAPPSDGTITPEPTPAPVFQIGDTIALRTGVIRDHNGRPVPDGTVARFSMTLTGEGGGILQQVEAVTSQGIARATFGLEKTGLLEIQVASEPALVSEAVQMDVSSTGPVEVTFVTPQLTPEADPTAAAPPPRDENAFITPEGYPRFSAWFLVLFLLAGGMWLTYWAVSRFNGMRTAIRWALCVLLGGLISYNYLALGLPGSLTWATDGGMPVILLITLLGELLGLAGAWLWHRRASVRAQ